MNENTVIIIDVVCFNSLDNELKIFTKTARISDRVKICELLLSKSDELNNCGIK